VELGIPFDCRLTVWPLTSRRDTRKMINIHKLTPPASNSLNEPVVLVGDLLTVVTRCSCCNQRGYDFIKGNISEKLSLKRMTGKVYLRVTSNNK